MAEFCSCGSLMIEGVCTNKNCATKAADKQATAKQAASRKAAKALKAAKIETAQTIQAKARRASKCITYNLNDVKEEEESQ